MGQMHSFAVHRLFENFAMVHLTAFRGCITLNMFWLVQCLGCDMKLTLVHPPFDDPTLPYHSIAYLAGHLKHNGFSQVHMRDLNIEFVNYALQEDVIQSFYREADARICLLKQQSHLTFS